MKLDEFVKTTLVQILEGVKEAQKLTKDTNKTGSHADSINPDIMYSADGAPKGKYFASQDRNLVHFVDFDVAVTIDTSSEIKGDAGIKVAGINLSANGQEINQNSIVSRIKFQVPIKLPKSQE
ncbi:MAG: hypothetical protein HY591_00570 [Candidatus Omnitrophica bacterium]|nr:hypothetical protein [Candidatus Omnitrophota bacterium]